MKTRRRGSVVPRKIWKAGCKRIFQCKTDPRSFWLKIPPTGGDRHTAMAPVTSRAARSGAVIFYHSFSLFKLFSFTAKPKEVWISRFHALLTTEQYLQLECRHSHSQLLVTSQLENAAVLLDSQAARMLVKIFNYLLSAWLNALKFCQLIYECSRINPHNTDYDWKLVVMTPIKEMLVNIYELPHVSYLHEKELNLCWIIPKTSSLFSNVLIKSFRISFQPSKCSCLLVKMDVVTWFLQP